MRIRSRWLMTIVPVVLLAVTPVPAVAQGRGGGAAAFPPGPVPRTQDGKPNLAGRWDGSGGAFTHTVILEEHAGGFGILAGKTLIIDPKDAVLIDDIAA